MTLFKRIFAWWLIFAVLVGRINTFILLTVLYFLVLTPIGLILRLLGKTPLTRSGGDSQWVKRVGEENLERQF